MIAIVNTGGANVASIRLALTRLHCESVLTAEPKVIRAADRVILPGVGAAADAMERLRKANLIGLLQQLDQPVLGICLGMHLLYDSSEEGPTPCLGIFPGQATSLPAAAAMPVPHMGWNQLNMRRECPLLRGIANGASVYFAHSFAVGVSEATSASTHYGADFAAVSRRGNFYATQFHPERSGAAGATLLQNFLNL